MPSPRRFARIAGAFYLLVFVFGIAALNTSGDTRFAANLRLDRDMVQQRFDTIAVHGLYSVEDAIEDYQGAIIEPIFMSSSQAYRDSDEMAAALAYLIPTWCYSRIANPSTYYYEWTLALLEGYGFDGETSCCSTSSGAFSPIR